MRTVLSAAALDLACTALARAHEGHGLPGPHLHPLEVLGLLAVGGGALWWWHRRNRR